MDNKKERFILGTNEAGEEYISKLIVKFLYFCFIASISYVLGYYTFSLLGWIVFILGLYPLVRKVIKRAKKDIDETNKRLQNKRK